MQDSSKPAYTKPVEAMEKSISSEPSSEHVDQVDAKLERRVRNKVDLHLMPVLFVLLLLAFLDRVNIGNA